MKTKIVSFLFILFFYSSVTKAAVIGWEVHNHTNHAVDVELLKHCMSDSAHDGPRTLAAGASYNYEELGTVASGTCAFERSYIKVRIYYPKFRKTFDTKFGCFIHDKHEENEDDSRVNMTSTNEGCKLKVRFDIIK